MAPYHWAIFPKFKNALAFLKKHLTNETIYSYTQLNNIRKALTEKSSLFGGIQRE